MTAYIRDLDGTLIDSCPVIAEAARGAVRRAGLTDPEQGKGSPETGE